MDKSWITQRLCNRLPPWTDARELPYSVFQQLLNPVGEGVEELYRHGLDGISNCYLTTANLDLMDIVHVVRLPNDYTFGQDQRNLNNPLYIPPRVTATVDGRTVWIDMAEDNTIETFWYTSVPTRVVDLDTSAIALPVIDETSLSDLEDVTPNTIQHPNRLSVTVSDCETFVDLTRRTPYSFLVLHGTTERELEETEVMLIPYNGVFTTSKIWKELDSVEYFGLQPDTGTVQIDSFAFNVGRQVDKYKLNVSSHTEKILYHRLGTHAFDEGTYSVHQHVSVIADTLDALYSGIDTLENIREIELGYDLNGTFTNVSLNDIAVQPFTGRIYGVDNTHLYIFEPEAPMPDYRGLKDRTAGGKMIIETDTLNYLRGETVELRPVWRLPTDRIYRNRWSVQKPDGTMVYFDIGGDETTAQDAWIGNKSYSYIKFGPFDSVSGEVYDQKLEYELTDRGTYLFALEVQYADGHIEKDICPIQVLHKEALARLALPATLQNATALAFDSDQRLWLQKAGSALEAHKVHLATDNMMVDYDSKMIYLHEDYEGTVTVYESEDWED